MAIEQKENLKENHLLFAKRTNNRVWDLLEKDQRSPAEDLEMLLAAFASQYHWMNAGTAVNIQRAYWVLSRVHQALNQAEAALEWALKCQEVTENNLAEMKDFDHAYAQEGLARSFALTGDLDKAKGHYDLAAELGEKITDPEDRAIFKQDFEGGDWYKIVNH
jgi:tetratricopeptide (TPR) repeat protein